MKHLGLEDWADFANQVATPEDRQAMERHLESGCTSCTEALRVWQRVRVMAAAEASYEPPANAVRFVKGHYVLDRPQTARPRRSLVARLVLDSLQQPALAGARAAGSSPRLLLYKAGDFLIDLRLEKLTDSGRFSVVGQVLNTSESQNRVHNVPVILVNQEGLSSSATTNQFGEFYLELDGTEDFYLFAGIGNGIEIALPSRRGGTAPPLGILE